MARIHLALLTLLALCCACQVLGSAVPKAKQLSSSKAIGAKKGSTKHVNPTSKFCKKFKKECYKVALSSNSGEHVKVVHECERHGKKHSHSYSFGCKVDNKDVTKKVLHNIGEGKIVTQSTTQIVPVTATAPVVTKTAGTETATVTATTTSVVAQVSVPVMQVVISPPTNNIPRSNKHNHVDKSTFCSAFTNGCDSQCVRLNSAAKHIVCHSTSLHHYTLACQCKSGKMETQHALYAAAGKDRIQTVATTSYTTVATAKPTKSVTATTFTTVTATATSTTQIVLATSGAVEVLSASDGTNKGYLYDTSYRAFLGPTTDKSSAVLFMAVLDPTSGLYQLQYADGSGNTIVEESDGADYDDGDNEYSFIVGIDLAASCSTAATRAGPADDEGCQTFIFGFKGDQQSIADGKTANLTMEYYNPNAIAAKEYYWMVDQNKYLYSVATPAAFALRFGSENPYQVYLRYPV